MFATGQTIVTPDMGAVPLSPPEHPGGGFPPFETAGARPDPVRSPGPLPDSRAHAEHLAELLARIVLRDVEAFSLLYDATVHRVFAAAKRIVGNHETAEEVVSDVYLQVWRDAARYDSARAQVQTWILLICRSRALDSLRRADCALVHPDPYVLIEPPSDDSSCGDLLLEALERGARVRAALELLPSLDRQLIALAFFRDYSHSEIASHSGLPLGTVKSRIRHALRVLRNGSGESIVEW